MLYSYNGKTPESLPHRIVLSDGTTRTDPTTFTDAEIADAGYVGVVDKPTVHYPEYVIWTGVDWEIRTKSLEAVKAELKAKAAEFRYNKETNHPTIDTSRASQAMINGAWSAVQIDPTMTVQFKGVGGVWVTLDKTGVESVADEVAKWVQECFAYERLLCAQIDVATTTTDAINVNLYDGWPSRVTVNDSDATV